MVKKQKNELIIYISVLLIMYVMFCHRWLIEFADQLDESQSLIAFHPLAERVLDLLDSVGLVDLSQISIDLWKSLIEFIFN
jgi:hypothetical protein